MAREQRPASVENNLFFSRSGPGFFSCHGFSLQDMGFHDFFSVQNFNNSATSNILYAPPASAQKRGVGDTHDT